MKTGDGFTLVELLAAITIMGILLTIGAIGLGNMRVDARDTERQTDIDNIARALESYYVNNKGSYPPTTTVDSLNKALATLPSTTSDIFRAPEVTTGTSFAVAQNTSSASSGLAPSISETDYSRYVYQPITSAGGLCTATTHECRRYNLFYRREADKKFMIIESKYR